MPKFIRSGRKAFLASVSIATLCGLGAGAAPAAAALYVESGGSLDGGGAKDLNAIAGYQVTSVEGSIFTTFSDQDAFYFSGLPTGVQTFVYDLTPITGSIFGYFAENQMTVDFLNSVSGVGMFTTSAAFNGTLAFHIEAEGNTASSNYSIGLVSAEVPIPGAAVLMAAGLAGLGAASRRRRANRR